MGEAAPQAAAGTGANIDEADAGCAALRARAAGGAQTGEITPEALAAEFPQWRMPTQAGDAWITMRDGPQEYHGPESLIMRTLSAPSIGELAEKLRFQAELDGLTRAQLTAVYQALRRPAPESAALR